MARSPMSFIPMPFSEADIPASPRLLDGHFRANAAGPQCLGLGRFLAGTNAPASENSVAHRKSLAQAAPDDAIPSSSSRVCEIGARGIQPRASGCVAATKKTLLSPPDRDLQAEGRCQAARKDLVSGRCLHHRARDAGRRLIHLRLLEDPLLQGIRRRYEPMSSEEGKPTHPMSREHGRVEGG